MLRTFSRKFIVTGVLAGALLLTAGCGSYRTHSYRYGYGARGSRHSEYNRYNRNYNRNYDDHHRWQQDRYRD